MPIGPVSPGDRTTVTPDSSPPYYTSLQAPSPTMPVIADDVASLTLALLNVQAAVRESLKFPQQCGFWLFDPADWIPGSGQRIVQQTSLARATKELLLPKGATITEVDIWIKPYDSGGTRLVPDELPAATLQYTDLTDNTDHPVTTFSDTFTTTAAYEAFHAMRKTGLSHVVGGSGARKYCLIFEGEDWGTFQPGLEVVAVSIFLEP